MNSQRSLDKKRIEEIREHHRRIRQIKERHLNLKDHISRNAALEYIEGVDFLLAKLDEAHAREESLRMALRDAVEGFDKAVKYADENERLCAQLDRWEKGVWLTIRNYLEMLKGKFVKARKALGEPCPENEGNEND